MSEGGVKTDAPTIVASLGEMAATIITSEGVEAVAPVVPPASGTPDGSSPRDSPGGSSDGPTEASPRAAPSLVDDASGDGDAAGQ